MIYVSTYIYLYLYLYTNTRTQHTHTHTHTYTHTRTYRLRRLVEALSKTNDKKVPRITINKTTFGSMFNLVKTK